ncbi:MAG TPA: anti-sigma factor [Candidatus Acidoferrales bacterium]
MNCRSAKRLLAGYLDGAIRPADRIYVREHVSSCSSCREHLERYRRLAVCLAHVRPAAPPADLAVRIRLTAVRSSSRANWPLRAWRRATLVFQNILEPMALPATGGILTAMVAFLFTVQGILVGAPVGVVQNDLPTSLMQPARLESLAPFPVTGITDVGAHGVDGVLILEATLNEQGQVVTYVILAGPSDPDVRRQLDQLLLFSRFSPQLSFGRPTAGGRVVLNWVLVRG